MDKEKAPESGWDLKLIPGGVIDIEFIAQYLALVAPAKASVVKVNGLNTGEALKALGGKLMAPADLDTCLEAFNLYTELSQLIRLCIDGLFDSKEAPYWNVVAPMTPREVWVVEGVPPTEHPWPCQ